MKISIPFLLFISLGAQAQQSIQVIDVNDMPKDLIFLEKSTDTLPVYIITPVAEFFGSMIYTNYECLKDIKNNVSGHTLQTPPVFRDHAWREVKADKIKMFSVVRFGAPWDKR